MESLALTDTPLTSLETAGDAAALDTGKAAGFTASRLGKVVTRFVTTAGVALAAGVLALTMGPRFLPYQTYTVLSGSMEPTLPVGSVIIAVPARGEELNTGDIITVANPQHAGVLVTHRIIAIGNGPEGRTFQTKGDANNVADSWVVPGTGNGWRYAFSIPYLGYALSTLQSDIGRMLLLVIPTVLLAGLLLVEIWLPARTPEKAPDGVVPAGA